MSKKREPPAYQEYAANMLANAEFRAMSLAERGLLYTIRLECWANKRLPADPEKLSRMLGQSLAEVSAALPAAASFTVVEDGFIVCPELDGYREHLEQRKAKQSEGGKKGAEKINRRHRVPEDPVGYPRSRCFPRRSAPVVKVPAPVVTELAPVVAMPPPVAMKPWYPLRTRLSQQRGRGSRLAETCMAA